MLEIEALSVRYGDRRVLDEVTFSVAAGEVVGLVGPNGSGKSTVLRAVTRVVPWEGGQVLIDGVPAQDLARRALAQRVAVVSQNPALPAGYTALEVVVMGRTPYLGLLAHEGAADYDRARAALARVGMPGIADRHVDELSGGERQAVVLARALAQESPILLLDEPTASLDIGHQVGVFHLASGLARGKRTAVLVAIHDLTLAGLYCDRLVLLAGGTVAASGPPDEVLTEDNILRAYGARTSVVRWRGFPGPVVVPYAAGAEAASGDDVPSPAVEEGIAG